MRPLFHPPVSDITVAGVLHALGDPVRARIYTELSVADEPLSCTAFALMGRLRLAKSSLSEHFRILREAGLIKSRRKGVEMLNESRAGELRRKFGPLIHEIVKAHLKERAG